MAEELGLPPDEVAERCAEYYLHYGTTLAGLVAHGCQVDYQRWHDRVHASLPYEKYLKVGAPYKLEGEGWGNDSSGE